MYVEEPCLYVIATPIGNLNDLTPRAAQILREVACVAAEDTRHSAVLLDFCNSRATRLAAHQHNEEKAAGQIVTRLQAGDSVALICDAGTPAISDPGTRLVARVREAGFPVRAVPGACAAIAALSISGLAEGRFLFVGFLPTKSEQRRRELAELAECRSALVFYEAPHRIVSALSALKDALGANRRVLIARELSKRFEQSVVCRLDEAEAWLSDDPNRQKGEFVLVVEGAPDKNTPGISQECERLLAALIDEGLPLKQVVRVAAAVYDIGKNELYKHALALRTGEADSQ